MSEIKIHVGKWDEKESAQDFIDAWHLAERGESPKEPIERLYFHDLKALFRILTPGRWTLLEKLHQVGPSSIRSISKKLGRDYKNVYQDVQKLDKAGLVMKDDNGIFSAPWSSIVADIAFDNEIT